MLPLGLGWSFWIHLFVQYPKTIAAVMLTFVLSSLPMKQTGLGSSDQSVGRTVLCTVIDAPMVGCGREPSAEIREKDPQPEKALQR